MNDNIVYMNNKIVFCTSEKLYKDSLAGVVETKKLYNNLLSVPLFMETRGIYRFIRSLVSEVDLLDQVTFYMKDYEYVGILKNSNIVFIKEVIFLTEEDMDNYYD